MDDRFRRVAESHTRRAVLQEAEDDIPVSNREAVSPQLYTWASAAACGQIFLPYLQALITQAEKQADAALENHARLAAATAVRRALIELRTDFEHWAGQE